MIELSFDKHLIGPFVCEKTNGRWIPDGSEAIGLVKDGEPIAGVLFEDYTGPGGSVSVHIALAHKRVPMRRLLITSAQYAFNQLGVRKVFGKVPSFNKAALKMDLRLGFKPIAVIPGAFPNGDMFLLEMTREECTFLPSNRKAA